jgi:hypothetical protein
MVQQISNIKVAELSLHISFFFHRQHYNFFANISSVKRRTNTMAICIRSIVCILGIASLGASAVIDPPKNDAKPAEQHKPWTLIDYCE